MIRGVQVSPNQQLSHVLFVDDVLLLGAATVEEWTNYHMITYVFCSAMGMMISSSKSILIHAEKVLQPEIAEIFAIDGVPLGEGFKYLGFFMKPNSYRIRDWVWLWKRIEKKINHWVNRYLTLGGRLTLAKSVLESMPVYWLSLYKVPCTILAGIRKRIFSFIWKGKNSLEKLHLARWEILAMPKNKGGWGIKNLSLFSQALRLKSLWRGLTANTFWGQVLIDKYLGKQYSVMEWLRMEHFQSTNTSIIWWGFTEVARWIK